MTRILVVEDHAVTREPLARLLRFEGFETVCACNGVEAQAALADGPVDLVLLDLLMPRMGGVEFLEVLRADPRYAALQVILLTGMPKSSTMSRARELGVSQVLPKAMFTVDHLLQAISRCLDNSSAFEAVAQTG